MNKDQVKGKGNEIAGEIKEQVGKMTGDRSTELKGHAQEVKGKLQKGYGDVKEDVKDDLERDRKVDEVIIEKDRKI